MSTNSFNSSSGPVRGLSRLEPYNLPPCGIHVDKKAVSFRTARHELTDGAAPSDLAQAGFTAIELARAGVSALELRYAGYSTLQIACTRQYDPRTLREAGCTVLECLGAGVRVPELVRSGFSAADFSAAGIGPAALRSLGIFPEDDDSPSSQTGPTRPASASASRSSRARQSCRPHTAAGSSSGRRRTTVGARPASADTTRRGGSTDVLRL